LRTCYGYGWIARDEYSRMTVRKSFSVHVRRRAEGIQGQSFQILQQLFWRRVAGPVLTVVKCKEATFGRCGLLSIKCCWPVPLMVIIFGCAGANDAGDPVFDCDQGSVSATLGLTANRNRPPFDGAIFIKKLLPVFSS